jgi:peptidoglycan/LPS O-acetylase OafA/YrhL
MRGRHVARVLCLITGAVALVAGLHGALTGVGGMAGDSAATTNVDSEYRFLSVFWAGFGALVLFVARRARPDPRAVGGLMTLLLCGGLARALSWAAEGRPEWPYLALLALELVVPVIVLALLAGERRSLR